MGTGYQRQSSGSIIPGNTVSAAHLNAEFNALESAFSTSVGHAHDGTAGNGPKLPPTSFNGLTANGLVMRTSDASFSTRTFNGTANQITVSNGDGVSGNPTLSFPYAVTFPGTVAATAFLGPLTGNAATATASTKLATPRLINGVAFDGTSDIVIPTVSGTATTATKLATPRLINGVAFDGSADITITSTVANPLTRGAYLTGDNYNGSAATTWAVDATSANTASKVVARDSSGNFSAGTITASLSGNATTATTIQTSRTINGVAFNGSSNITINAVDSTARLATTGGTLTGNLDGTTFRGTAGTAGAPTYSFVGAPDTGMYSGGANVLVLATGGTERLKITAAGDIGINNPTITPSPDSRYFTIKGPANGLGYASIRLQSGVSSAEALVQCAGSAGDLLMLSGPGGATSVAAGAYVQIVTANAERARMTATGELLLGQAATTTPGYLNATVGHAYWGEHGRAFISQDDFSNWNMNKDGVLINISRSGTTVGSISVSSTATSYNTASDYRLKENVVPLDGAVARLSRLKPSRFNFKADPGNTVDGFIAHEVQAVVPEAVIGTRDAVDTDGNPVYQAMDAAKLVPLLVASIQELKARIELLEAASN